MDDTLNPAAEAESSPGATSATLTPSQTPALPLIGSRWQGGTYAGLIHTPEGLHHLVLLDDKPTQRMSWADGLAWTESVGGDMPTRVESLVLYTHLADHFERAWHWTKTQHSDDASYAWGQNFSYGSQFSYLKSFEGRVRAVRRLKLDPSILSGAAQ